MGGMPEEEIAPSTVPPPAKKGRGLWIGIAIVVVVVAIILAAVLGGVFAPPEQNTLKIGTVLSITGGLSAFGTKNRQGITMAVDQINAAGGVIGQPIQLFNQDSRTDAAVARSAASTLVSQNRVDAIIGATGSGQCSTVIEVAKANSVYEMSGSCTSPKFSNTTLTQGWWGRTAPSDALQGVVAASYARTNLTFARAAVIGINNDYGVGLAKVFNDNFIRFGGTMVAPPRIVTETQQGATSYSADLAALLNTNPAPQVLYIVAYPPDGILMVQNFEAGLAANPGWANVQLLFSEGVFEQAAFLNVLKNAPNNFDTSSYLGTAPSAYGGVVGPLYPAWAATYTTKWGAAPGLFDANYYDAAFLIALAAQKAGTATGAAVKAEIAGVANPPGTVILPGEWTKALAEFAAGRGIDYEGASGSVNIDALGDPFSGYVVWAVDAAGTAFNQEIFPEPLVRSLLPAPPESVSGPSVQKVGVWTPLVRTRDLV